MTVDRRNRPSNSGAWLFMRARALAVLLLLPALVGLVPATAAASTASPYDLIYIEGQRGDLITSFGNSVNLTSPNHVAAITAVGAGVRVSMTRVADGLVSITTATLQPPTGSALAVGGPFLTTKAPTADTWGLEVRSKSTCAASSGHVTIHELALDPTDSHVTSIAFSYDQACAASPALPIYGDVRVQSTRDYRTASANPATLFFNNTLLHQTTAAGSVTMTAGGTAPLTTGPATITGSAAADFAVTDDGCATAPVAPGTTCTVSVAFTANARGNRLAALHIPDGTTHGERVVTLAGYGWELPAAPTGLVARAASDGVALSWTATTDDGGATTPVNYRILRGEPGGTLSEIGSRNSLQSQTFGDVISPTTLADHDYEYAVQTVSGAGASPASNSATAHTPATNPSGLPQAFSLDSPAGNDHPRTSQVLTSASGSPFSGSGTSRQRMYIASTNLSLSLHAPPGEEVRPGTFATGPFTESNGWGMTIDQGSPYCYGPSTGSITIVDAQFTANDAPAVLDADLTWACGSQTPLHASVRFHSSRPYEGVLISPPTTVLVTGIAPTTLDNVIYRNAGTTPITVSAVTLVPDDLAGSAPTPQSDWAITGETCAGVVLAPSETCTATVQLNASALGERRVVIRFTDSTSLGSQERMITVQARGLPPAADQFRAAYLGPSSLTLFWTAASTDPNLRAAQWHVFKGDTATSLTEVARTPAVEFHDSDTAPKLRYYQIQAENVAGLGPLSQVFTVDTRPSPPTALAASGLARRVGFTWSPPANISPQPVTSYAVYTGTTATTLTRTVTSNLWTSVRGLAPGAKAYIKVAALFGTTEGPPTALVSGTAGTSQVVVVSENNGLAAIPVNGGKPIPFPTTGLNGFATPAVSRDGRQVAFSASTCLNCVNHLYVLPYDGSGTPRRLTSSTEEEYNPTFSADAKLVAFDTAPEGGAFSPRLATVLATGGGFAIRPNSWALEDPSFVGTTTTLVATDLTSASAPLRRVTSAGVVSAVPGTAGGFQPEVSSDGSRVAYAVENPDLTDRLMITTLATGVTTPQASAGSGYILGLSWSFNSKSLTYSLLPPVGRIARVWTTLVGTTTHTVLSGTVWSTEDPAVDQLDLTAPTVRITAPATTSTTATSVKVAWTATDLQAGVLTSDVRYRRAKGTGALSGYIVPSGWTGTTASYKTLAVLTGYRYCFSVRTRDRAGNTSAWTAERCITKK